MTQDKQEPFDFNSMFDRLKTMVWKNCTECGQETHNLPEADLCLECRYNQEHPGKATCTGRGARKDAPGGGS